MNKVIEQKINDVHFFMEVSPEPEIVSQERVGGEQSGVTTELAKFQDRLEEIASAISVTCSSIQSKLVPQPSKGAKMEELEIEFGIKLSVEAGVILTKAAGEGSIKVTAKIKFN